MACALLTETRKIVAIYWPGDGEPEQREGNSHAVVFQIVPVNGEMTAVPWVRVEFDDGRFQLHNAAHLETIEYEAEAP